MAGATTHRKVQCGLTPGALQLLHIFWHSFRHTFRHIPPGIFRHVPRAAIARVAVLALTASIAIVSPVSIAQTDFQIVWVIIGEAATAENGGSARAGRHLFMAPDLLAMSMDNVKVTRVDVQPVETEIVLGERLCLSSLSMRAFGADQQLVPAAPLSVAVRQDHRERLGLRRSRRDVCLQPQAAGEYPVRLTSLMPAPDGTMRGAQVFLRVKPASDPALP